MARSTAQVAEGPHPPPRPHIVADLHLEVGDDRGRTTAALTGDQDGLVLDVDEPAVLLRALPGGGLARDFPFRVPRELLGNVSVRLRSGGRDLGRLRLTATGKLRVRPTLAGLLVAGRTTVSYSPSRRPVVGAMAVAAALAVAATLRRRRG